MPLGDPPSAPPGHSPGSGLLGPVGIARDDPVSVQGPPHRPQRPHRSPRASPAVPTAPCPHLSRGLCWVHGGAPCGLNPDSLVSVTLSVLSPAPWPLVYLYICSNHFLIFESGILGVLCFLDAAPFRYVICRCFFCPVRCLFFSLESTF